MLAEYTNDNNKASAHFYQEGGRSEGLGVWCTSLFSMESSSIFILESEDKNRHEESDNFQNVTDKIIKVIR